MKRKKNKKYCKNCVHHNTFHGCLKNWTNKNRYICSEQNKNKDCKYYEDIRKEGNSTYTYHQMILDIEEVKQKIITECKCLKRFPVYKALKETQKIATKRIDEGFEGYDR